MSITQSSRTTYYYECSSPGCGEASIPGHHIGIALDNARKAGWTKLGQDSEPLCPKHGEIRTRQRMEINKLLQKRTDWVLDFTDDPNVVRIIFDDADDLTHFFPRHEKDCR